VAVRKLKLGLLLLRLQTRLQSLWDSDFCSKGRHSNFIVDSYI